jgi:hypothetical protein
VADPGKKLTGGLMYRKTMDIPACYQQLAKCPRVAADSLLSFLFPSTLSFQ